MTFRSRLSAGVSSSVSTDYLATSPSEIYRVKDKRQAGLLAPAKKLTRDKCKNSP
jgi:hypothetical protein